MGRDTKASPPETRAVWKNPVVIAAAIALVGVLITVVFDYLRTQLEVERPIAATQTAEAKLAAIPTDTPLPSSTPTFTPPPTLMETPAPTLLAAGGGGVSQWCDDFNDGRIDENKWLLPTDENYIYGRDGVLNLLNEVQAENLVGASLEATGAGRPIREVSFTITLESYQGGIAGAAGLEVHLEGGRDLSVDVGPGSNDPGVEFSICRNPPCSGDYNEYDHPDGGPFPVGVSTPVRVVWTGEKVEFYVDNVFRVEQSVDPGPITELQFYMYADPGSVFHAKVDDVCVIYADG